jgi:hypothetical protein
MLAYAKGDLLAILILEKEYDDSLKDSNLENNIKQPRDILDYAKIYQGDDRDVFINRAQHRLDPKVDNKLEKREEIAPEKIKEAKFDVFLKNDYEKVEKSSLEVAYQHIGSDTNLYAEFLEYAEKSDPIKFKSNLAKDYNNRKFVTALLENTKLHDHLKHNNIRLYEELQKTERELFKSAKAFKVGTKVLSIAKFFAPEEESLQQVVKNPMLKKLNKIIVNKNYRWALFILLDNTQIVDKKVVFDNQFNDIFQTLMVNFVKKFPEIQSDYEAELKKIYPKAEYGDNINKFLACNTTARDIYATDNAKLVSHIIRHNIEVNKKGMVDFVKNFYEEMGWQKLQEKYPNLVNDIQAYIRVMEPDENKWSKDIKDFLNKSLDGVVVNSSSRSATPVDEGAQREALFAKGPTKPLVTKEPPKVPEAAKRPQFVDLMNLETRLHLKIKDQGKMNEAYVTVYSALKRMNPNNKSFQYKDFVKLNEILQDLYNRKASSEKSSPVAITINQLDHGVNFYIEHKKDFNKIIEAADTIFGVEQEFRINCIDLLIAKTKNDVNKFKKIIEVKEKIFGAKFMTNNDFDLLYKIAKNDENNFKKIIQAKEKIFGPDAIGIVDLGLLYTNAKSDLNNFKKIAEAKEKIFGSKPISCEELMLVKNVAVSIFQEGLVTKNENLIGYLEEFANFKKDMYGSQPVGKTQLDEINQKLDKLSKQPVSTGGKTKEQLLKDAIKPGWNKPKSLIQKVMELLGMTSGVSKANVQALSETRDKTGRH